MKIASVTVNLLKVPLARTYESGGREVKGFWHVLTRLTTDDGVQAFGFSFFQQESLVAAVLSATRELGRELVGRSVLDVEGTWEHLAHVGRHVGPGGLLHFAISSLDIAMWDAAGKTVGQPLYRLLGGYRDRVPAYASDGFTYDRPVEELVANAKARAADGFKALKMRLLGKDATPEAEVRRYTAVREAVGPDFKILLEAAQRYNVGQALRCGRALQEAGAHWLEDPVWHKNFDDLSVIASRLDIPIATGEKLYELSDFARLFELRAAGVAIIDLGNIGGFTPWRRVAALAHAHALPVCGHVIPELHVHPLAAIPNGYLLEYAPRSAALFESSPKLENGALVAPGGPGLGLMLDEDAVKRFEIA